MSFQLKFRVHSCILCCLIAFRLPIHLLIFLFPVICFNLSITRTPDNLNFFSISLEGSSYGESTVVHLKRRSTFPIPGNLTGSAFLRRSGKSRNFRTFINFALNNTHFNSSFFRFFGIFTRNIYLPFAVCSGEFSGIFSLKLKNPLLCMHCVPFISAQGFSVN